MAKKWEDLSRSEKIKRLKNKADRIHSKYIRRGNARCVCCGTDQGLQCGHIFGRRATNTRWDTDPDGNCHVQCDGCNKLHNYDPFPYNNWYITKWGQEAWENLHKRYKTIAPALSLGRITAVIEDLERLMDEYQSGESGTDDTSQDSVVAEPEVCSSDEPEKSTDDLVRAVLTNWRMPPC